MASRKCQRLLFHGNILLDFDLSLIEKLLLLPPRQPDYRRNRTHPEFVTQLALSAESVKAALQNQWQVDARLAEVPRGRVDQLVAGHYSRDKWNLRR